MTLKPHKFKGFVREWVSRHPISSSLVLIPIAPIIVLYPLAIVIEKMFTIDLWSSYDGWILVLIYAVLVGLMGRWIDKGEQENSTGEKTD